MTNNGSYPEIDLEEPRLYNETIIQYNVEMHRNQLCQITNICSSMIHVLHVDDFLRKGGIISSTTTTTDLVTKNHTESIAFARFMLIFVMII